MTDISRRCFIGSAAAVALTVFATETAEGVTWYKVAKKSAFAVNKPKIVRFGAPGTFVSIVVTKTGVIAFRPTCTHQFKPLKVAQGKLYCPEHGSQFDPKTGKVLRAPAQQPLRKYTARVKNGYVYVTMDF